MYTTNGVGNVIPGLRDSTSGHPSLYNVVVVGTNNDTLQFGNLFKTGAVDGGSIPSSDQGVDTNRDLIRFPFAHNFRTGDPVILSAAAGQSLGSIGATPGTTYYVRVIDPFDVALYASQADATAAPNTFDPSNVSGNDIQVSNSFSNSGSYRVTYTSAPPLPFGADGVNVDPNNYQNSCGGCYDIVVGPIDAPNHNADDGLVTGQAVVYQSTGPDLVGNLTNGHTYYVITDGTKAIQLAASYCEAVGCDPDGQPDNSTNGFDDIAVNPSTSRRRPAARARSGSSRSPSAD